MSGDVLPDPDCIPGSTYYCPLTSQGLSDIKNDRSLSMLYFFPKQLAPHRSALLPGTRRPARVLSPNDLEVTRQGGRGRGRGWDNRARARGNGFDRNRNDPFHSRLNNYSSQPHGNDYNRGDYNNRGRYSYQQSSYSARTPYQAPPVNSGYDGSYGGMGTRPAHNYSGYGGYGGDSSSYSRGGYAASNFNNARNGYGSASSSDNYNGYRSGENGGYSGYGGYGGYGTSSYPPSYPPRSGNPGYHNGGPTQSRGRGRGW